MTAFDALFVPAELRLAVSGRSWLEAMLEMERALAAAGAAVGLVPGPSADAIASACSDADAYSWDGLLDDGRAVGNPAEPLVRALRARVFAVHRERDADAMERALRFLALLRNAIGRGALEPVGEGSVVGAQLAVGGPHFVIARRGHGTFGGRSKGPSKRRATGASA